MVKRVLIFKFCEFLLLECLLVLLVLCRGLFDALDSGGECGVPYERRLAMPRPSPDEPW